MKRTVEDWTLGDLHKKRAQISFPEYQRQPNLWTLDRKRLLIDSILREIDIPKLYFNRTEDGEFEVVDGQQRLWAVWEFMEDQYDYYVTEDKPVKFSKLSAKQRQAIQDYEVQVTTLEDADDEYLRTLFVRLQLGLLLVTGEKLHAATGEMKEFVFEILSRKKFMQHLGMPVRRYAGETLGAQIAINSFTRAKQQGFARTRYEDLAFFFKEYEHPVGDDKKFFKSQCGQVLDTLDFLWQTFAERAKELRNRSYILSIYLLAEELRPDLDAAKERKRYMDFVFSLAKRLREESKAGIDRTNRELYTFSTLLSSAPGERYQIERRHQKLIEYYRYFEKSGKVKGD